MKKTAVVLALAWCGVTAWAQEFSIQWLDTMAGYLGRSARDIPKIYRQAEVDRSVYNRTSIDNITETFSVDERDRIAGVGWIKISPTPQTEYNRVLGILETTLGVPMFKDGDQRMLLWDWRNSPLMLQIQDNAVIVGVVTLEAVGVTQEEWEQVIQLSELMRSLSQ